MTVENAKQKTIPVTIISEGKKPIKSFLALTLKGIKEIENKSDVAYHVVTDSDLMAGGEV